MKEAEALLKHLGLTQYESKALLVLLRQGKSTADRISAIGGIPLPRVYDTMTSLSGRGLISISKTRPQTFKAIDPKRFFELMKEDEKRKLEERVNIINGIAPQFLKLVSEFPEPSKSEEEVIAYLRRRMNVGRVWEEIQSETKKEFLVFAGDLSWVNGRVKDIRKSVKKGVKYRILSCKPTKEISKNIRLAIRAGAEVRFFKENREFRGFIADAEKVYLIDKTLKSGSKKLKEGMHWSEEIANYTGITMNSKLIADIFRRYFNHLWKRAVPAEKFLKRLK